MPAEERIRLHLLENAFDYLLSAAEYASLKSPRSWKYAILHLVAGIELLLKARLQHEHWSLLFQRVDQATEAILQSGTFISVDFDTACTRLQNIAGVIIAQLELEHLRELRGIRNRIQHFAIDIEIAQVISLVVRGLNFSLEFSRTNLPSQIVTMERQLSQIYRRIRKFEEFVSSRLEEIRPQLEAANDLIECRVCWQETLMIGDGDPHRPFCGFTRSAQELSEILWEGSWEGECIECGAETLCFVLYNNEDGAVYCTSCGTTQRVCLSCYKRFIGEGDYCPECLASGANTGE